MQYVTTPTCNYVEARDNYQVLIVKGEGANGNHYYDIYDDKNEKWYPYYKIASHSEWQKPVACIGKYLYSVGHNAQVWENKLFLLDLENGFDYATLTVPITTNCVAVSDETIYIMADRKLFKLNNTDQVFGQCSPTFTRNYSKENDQAFLTCQGDVYGFSHSFSECYKSETQQIHQVRFPTSLPIEFRATSLNDRIYFTNLRKCYDFMHVYVPENDSWYRFLPNNKCQLNNEHFSEIIAHDGKLVSINNDRQILVYDPTENEWDFLCAQYVGIMDQFTCGFSVSRHVLRNL